MFCRMSADHAGLVPSASVISMSYGVVRSGILSLSRRVMNNMMVRKDKSVRRDDYPGAGAFLLGT